MAFQRVPNTVEIAHLFTLNGKMVQNVYYARLPTPYVQLDLQDIADVVDTVFTTTFNNEMSGEVVYVRTEVRGLNAPNDLTATQNLGTGAGLQGSSVLPNQVTFSIKQESGLTGRSARGRVYWIGVPRGILDPLDENLVIPAWAASVVADVDFVRFKIESVGLWEAVLVSRFAEKVKRPEGVLFPWLTTTNVNLRVDTLRGRLPDV